MVGGDGEVAEVHRALEDGSEESALATILGDVLAGVLIESRVCVLLLPSLGIGRLPACPSFIRINSLDILHLFTIPALLGRSRALTSVALHSKEFGGCLPAIRSLCIEICLLALLEQGRRLLPSGAAWTAASRRTACG